MRRLIPSLDNPPSRALRCALGLLVGVGASLLRYALQPVLKDQVPFALSIGATAVATWVAGVEGGIVAILASAVLVQYLVVRPRFAFSVAENVPGEIVFLIVGLFLVWQVNRWRRAEQALRRSEAQARESEAEIASIYDSAPIGLCIFDREGRYLRINRRLAEINGLPPEAHIGRTFHELVPGIAAQAQTLLRQVLDTGRPATDVEIRGELPSRPGVVRTWSEHWFPVRDDEGTVIGVNVAIEEITERKRVEEELRHANQVKDDFLATLSHELRTPLNAILGWAQMLAQGALDERVKQQAADTIFRNAQAQHQLVTDVLDVSRMISGKLRLQVQEVDAVSLLRQAIESMQPAADAKQLALHLSVEAEPVMLLADPGRLQQVVWNLLSNAVKFTEAGGEIKVSITRGHNSVEITVADTGVGIRPEFMPRLFERFSQADSSASRLHSGLGLGLSIVRHLVELHGGRVYAMSEGEGRGATFTVSFPARVARQATAREDRTRETPDPAMPGAVPKSLRVLVVDDVEDARELLAAILEREGMRVIAASTAQEALESVVTARPDVILADIGMPGVDGYEFLRRVRELSAESGGSTPAIAVTAYGGETNRARALAAGFTAHVTKPVTRDDLLAAIVKSSNP